MKICIVNIKNCIDYSQYGPFLFEYIKSGDCIIYNEVNDSKDLDEIYEKILSEYNRNAFGNNDTKLVFFIPRDMNSLNITDYEFYHDINIYMHIISKVNIFSQIITFYIDNCKECVKGAEHRKTVEVSECFYSSDNKFQKYMPVFSGKFENKKEIEAAVENVTDPVFNAFFKRVLEDVPDNLDESYAKQLMNVFSSKCAEKLPRIEKIYEIVNPYDVADNILKMLRIIYFIRLLLDDSNKGAKDYEDFSLDVERIKQVISTYKNRLNLWLNAEYDKDYPEIDKIEVFEKQNNVQQFISSIDEIINVQLADLDGMKADSVDVVKIVFDKLGVIVKNADDEMDRFVQKDIDAYFDKSKYTEETAAHISKDKHDEIKLEKDTTDALNMYSKVTLPGFTEQLRLEQRLENANKQINDLLKCRREYSFKMFLGTFITSCIAVIVLYFIAQVSVFVKENSMWIFGAYSIFITLSFFSVYTAMSVNYKHKIGKLMELCKKEVVTFLRNYKIMAEEFENNLNIMADYACLKKYLSMKAYVEEIRNADINKFNWHKRKVREILDNLNHFNDFIRNISPVHETKMTGIKNYDDDAEHTEFYQMKVF